MSQSIKTISFIQAPSTMRKLTLCQGKNATRASQLSASFCLQPSWKNLLSVKVRMPDEHQDCQLHSSFSYHQTTYCFLSRQECHKSITTLSFILPPAIKRELTSCQGKNATWPSRLSAPFQLQLPWDNLLPVKTKSIKTVSFIPGQATMREFTACQIKNAMKAWQLSTSFHLQPPWENLLSVNVRMPQEHQNCSLHSSSIPSDNLLPVKARMPQEHQDCQLHSISSYHERTYILSRHKCHKSIKSVSFIPSPATMRELTFCPGTNATRALRLSASFHLQLPWENLLSVQAQMPQ
jgi:hypothetical protein